VTQHYPGQYPDYPPDPAHQTRPPTGPGIYEPPYPRPEVPEPEPGEGIGPADVYTGAAPGQWATPPDQWANRPEEDAAAPAVGGESVDDVILDVRDLHVYYGAAAALKGVNFHVKRGEVVTIIGANGAGKSTTMKTVSGVSELLKSQEGTIYFRGVPVQGLPAYELQRIGIAHVPEGRRVFPETSVEDNLLLGSYSRFRADRSRLEDDLDAIYQRFPVLKDRRKRPAGFLSGGEQQMLAIGRGLMSRPHLLLLDEPSLGLAPLMIQQVFEIVKELSAAGTTILLVEQMAIQALGVADRGYVLETGKITLMGTGEELLNDDRVKEAYLGA
jgi:branched-chain amino acid transport system ATP-binding protein